MLLCVWGCNKTDIKHFKSVEGVVKFFSFSKTKEKCIILFVYLLEIKLQLLAYLAKFSDQRSTKQSKECYFEGQGTHNFSELFYNNSIFSQYAWTHNTNTNCPHSATQEQGYLLFTCYLQRSSTSGDTDLLPGTYSCLKFLV